ncbi:DEAD/DEAH box helicase family protein, partial [Armatimonas sp.]|uniref:DEAD/DEAH box helicase family protein n=1 Tax=Armatimonas sp. TaxID=1872638 RepID=UPI0034D97A5B
MRYWNRGTKPEPEEEESFDNPVVMVASIQTLNSRKNNSELKCFANPSMFVIDECHHGITNSYRDILKRINPTNKSNLDEPMIVGLSATLFRSKGEDESRKLKTLFNNNLYPKSENQNDIYKKLTNRKILSEIGNFPIEIKHPYLKDRYINSNFDDKVGKIFDKFRHFNEYSSKKEELNEINRRFKIKLINMKESNKSTDEMIDYLKHHVDDKKEFIGDGKNPFLLSSGNVADDINIKNIFNDILNEKLDKVEENWNSDNKVKEK